MGKNESGKTSLLQALYKLNPIVPEQRKYDVVDPRNKINEKMLGRFELAFVPLTKLIGK